MPRRVPAPTREDVPEQHRAAYDEVAAPSRWGLWLRANLSAGQQSRNGARANNLAEYLRKESDLPQKIRELAMLIAARTMDCQFVWNAHAALGRQAGLSDATVDSLRDRQPLPASVPADEAVAVRYGLEVCLDHQVTDATFRAALDQFGAKALTEFTTFMGYYRILALNANAFDIDLPANITEAFAAGVGPYTCARGFAVGSRRGRAAFRPTILARSSSFTPSRISSQDLHGAGESGLGVGVVRPPHQGVHSDDIPQPDAYLVFLEAEVDVLAEEIAGHHVVS